MELEGKQIIGQELSAAGQASITAADPASGEQLPTAFHCATPAEIDRAVELARAAAPVMRQLSGEQRGVFLQRVADELEGIGEQLTARAQAECGLPMARMQGELGRTTGQLRLFAQLAREGSWVDARIDHALPDRTPLPRPDLRRMLIPVGPVAVFCASNFPLAFSVAGVDPASALAAGCPVIVKAHHAHPGTAELTARAIQQAAAACDMPAGTFSLLHGPGREVGRALVLHPAIKAVGFTGSQAGGRHLFDLAAGRPEPIPVYAEMSSINPVFMLPGALRERPSELAAGLHESLTLGVGQFCTNPGTVVLMDGEGTRDFLDELGRLVRETPAAPMLHKGIRVAYGDGMARLDDASDVALTARAGEDAGPGGCHADAAVYTTTAASFMADPALREEVFGPTTLVIRCKDEGELLAIARTFTGELSSSMHGSPAEIGQHRELVSVLEARAGRLVFNGFPTGVEVCHAMNHGGPYPATTDVHFTSVGTAAIFRFARPVCYQSCPPDSLPDELKDGNPLGIMRMVDGELVRE